MTRGHPLLSLLSEALLDPEPLCLGLVFFPVLFTLLLVPQLEGGHDALGHLLHRHPLLDKGKVAPLVLFNQFAAADLLVDGEGGVDEDGEHVHQQTEQVRVVGEVNDAPGHKLD